MLHFSKKFPPSLQRTVSLLHTEADYSSNLEKASLIARLVADSRMDVVWNELTKRMRANHKPTPGYFRAARPPAWAAAMSAEDAQTKALAELFSWIVFNVEYCWTKDEGSLVVDRLRRRADLLRRTGRSAKEANVLSKAADIYESLPEPDQARGVVLELASYFEERFGDPMYGTTAAIVSVAMKQNVTRAKVRNWCSATMIKTGQNDQPGSYS